MPSTNDPISTATRRNHAALAICAMTTIACAIWALMPMSQPNLTVPTLNAPTTDTHTEDKPNLDARLFAVDLWNPPPVQINPTQTAATQRPTPSPKYELIGIINDQTQDGPILRAALYDPAADQLLIVTSGDIIGTHTVSSIDEEAVTLADARGQTRLELHPKGGR